LPSDLPKQNAADVSVLEEENARLRHDLAAAEARYRRLHAELQRRFRNALAVVGSMVRHTARTNETLEDYVMHLESRLGAVARSQLMASRWPDEAVGIQLDELLAEELLAHNAHEDGTVTLAGPPVRLRVGAAATLGLVFHELALNAVEYGALSAEPGRITVTWGSDDDAVLRLQWVETGGPKPEPDRRRGFGTELIRNTLAYELGAEASLEYPDEGLRCVLQLPLSTIAASPTEQLDAWKDRDA